MKDLMTDSMVEFDQIPELLNMVILNIQDFTETLKSDIINKITDFYNIRI